MLFFEFPEDPRWNGKRDCVAPGLPRAPRSAPDTGVVRQGVPPPAHPVEMIVERVVAAY
ncbi:MAG TPA: hypothetical protein VGJ20_29625 [Xanthobacteraceae bacterium]|jgi:hypothetical protein